MRDVTIEQDTFNGKPILSISWTDDDRYPFSFGIQKAKMLATALKKEPDLLEDFISEHS
jgi:hypothetical protein